MIIYLQNLANQLPDAFVDTKKVTKSHIPAANVPAKDENIGFDGYIGTWILRIYRIYRRYIDGYFYMNIDI